MRRKSCIFSACFAENNGRFVRIKIDVRRCFKNTTVFLDVEKFTFQGHGRLLGWVMNGVGWGHGCHL